MCFSLAAGIVAVAILTKLVGCGLPSMLFLKDRGKAMKVGIGMVSRGEVGLIVAGVGVSSKILTSDAQGLLHTNTLLQTK